MSPLTLLPPPCSQISLFHSTQLNSLPSMAIGGFCSRFYVLILLLSLSCPYKFIQSPMDFGPLNLLQTTKTASLDFGRIVFNSPSAVLRPQSPGDISLLLSFLSSSSLSKVTVAARGAGHSIHGQAQALDGIVIEMDSLPSEIVIHKRHEGQLGFSYADVSGGALWIELLEESLKHGLAPRSWTDYLYLSIGGTLSNAGISGQTFKYGPQTSNVLQLEVVTGKGEEVTCSPEANAELFNAVLGGLGQFGIITKARILLQEAPEKVRWARAFYDDFSTFTKDQELLVSMPELVDYVEGFIVLNQYTLQSSSIAFPADINFDPDFGSGDAPKMYYCIEFAVHDYKLKNNNLERVVRDMADQMNFISPHLYTVEVSYFDFLNRVGMEEMDLRMKGLWNVYHPWLNMFVPKSGITEFKDVLMESITPDGFDGLVLIYPLVRDKWDTNTSVVLPEKEPDDVMYVVGVLRSADPEVCSRSCLQELLQRHRQVAETAVTRLGAKQYLAHHGSTSKWVEHFGTRWARFAGLKSIFDPTCILSPGQGMFSRITPASTH